MRGSRTMKRDILPRQIKDCAVGFQNSQFGFPGFSLAGLRHLPRLSYLNLW
jgi:hypothetical protein